MSIIVDEKPASRKQSGANQSRRASREYIILNATSDIDAKAALGAYVVSNSLGEYDGLTLDSPDVREAYPGIYDATLNWITPARKEEKEKEEQQTEQEPGDPPVVNFGTTGGTRHTNVAEETAIWGDGAPDPGLLIGVQDDGSVTGCDIPAPVLNWTEQHTFLKADLSWSYIAKLKEMTGMINDAEFRSQPAQSVRFMGVTGASKSDTKETLTFTFESAEEEDNIDMGDGVVISHKKGFDYVSVRTKVDVDDTAKTTTRKTIGAYTQRVHKLGDFSELGIGTGEIAL